jgi:AcrR family transcriptional regulator
MSTTDSATTKGRATGDRILDGATALVLERGIARTTLDDVPEVTKASKGHLYYYFADKDDLIHVVIDRTIQQVLDAQPRLADLPSWSAIGTWSDDLVALQARHRAIGGCPIGSLVGELAETDEQARAALSAGLDRWEAPLRTGLERMRARGQLARNADPARLATATHAAIQGALVLTQARRDPQQLRIAPDAAYAHLRSFAV